MSEASTQGDLAALRANMESAVLGKPNVVKLTVTALLAAEHILLEDVPGVGKTLIAKALARSIDGKFTRLQFTPDLLPSDITGSSIYNSNDGQFTFNTGPIFANVVLADEINRAPPRTQSALLEAMGEGQVSADGETHQLPSPLLVIAPASKRPSTVIHKASRGGRSKLQHIRAEATIQPDVILVLQCRTPSAFATTPLPVL